MTANSLVFSNRPLRVATARSIRQPRVASFESESKEPSAGRALEPGRLLEIQGSTGLSRGMHQGRGAFS
jgi:hypothetical protein